MYQKLRIAAVVMSIIFLCNNCKSTDPRYYIDYDNGAREYFGSIKVTSRTTSANIPVSKAKIVLNAVMRTGDGSRFLTAPFIAVKINYHATKKEENYYLSKSKEGIIELDSGIITLSVTADSKRPALRLDSLSLKSKEMLEVEAVIPYIVIK